MPSVAHHTGVPPRLLVSILNWNTPDLVLRALEALGQSVGCDFDVCIVDNGSSDHSVPLLAALAPGVTCIGLAENRGFAGGHAAALELARTQGHTVLCLLNSDAVVAPDTLAQLLAAWQMHGEGLYGAVPWQWRDGRRMANLPTKYLDPAAVPRAWQRDHALELSADWDRQPARMVAAVPGGCLLVPLSLVARVGWMGSEWFLYCEELDWCLRLRAAGVRSWLVPAAQCHHEGGGSGAARPDAALRATVAYYQARNEIVLADRHAGRWTARQIAAKKLLRALAQSLGSPRRAWALVVGVTDALLGRMGQTRRTVATARAARAPWRWPLSLEALADKLLEALHRRGLDCRPAGGSTLLLERKPARLIRAFHHEVARLLREALVPLATPVQAQLGPGPAPVGTWRVDLQIEHTLVRPGGRDSAGALPGPVPLPEGDGHYLVRLVEPERLATADLIVDYSRPNLAHLQLSGQFAELRRRMRAIAPLWYPDDFGRAGRDLAVITQFADLGQPRRARFLDECKRAGLAVRNVRGIWRPASLRRLYRRTSILVNVHQTDHHHTFEELRVLPALANGVIVISEAVPLRECVPYHDFVLWSDLADLPRRIAEVQADLAGWHARLFGDGRLSRLLAILRLENQQQLRAALQDWQTAQGTARPMPAS